MTAAQRIGAHYDAYHDLYLGVWGEQLHHGLWRTGRESQAEAVEALTRQVAEWAGLRPGLRVYDVGCGYGAVSEWLVREFGVQVVGVTCSAAQFVRCERRVAPGLAFHGGDWLAMEVGKVDRVIALECVDHMADKGAFFAQCARALEEGGRLVIAGWVAGDTLTPRQGRKLRQLCARDPVPDLWSARAYREGAEAAGFEIERQTDLTRETAPTWPRYAGQFALKAMRDPRLMRFVGGKPGGAGWLPLTFWRILSAFRSGALRYSIMTARYLAQS